LLSILACDAIALPLSPAFPLCELKYILENSQASILLATEKYAGKAQEVVQAALGKTHILDIIEKIKVGANRPGQLAFRDMEGAQAGLMLYTSGTTNRPVRDCQLSRGEKYAWR
jgi:acyl-coenzyme A synthetase/AMP-(fatty) acid ligase